MKLIRTILHHLRYDRLGGPPPWAYA